MLPHFLLWPWPQCPIVPPVSHFQDLFQHTFPYSWNLFYSVSPVIYLLFLQNLPGILFLCNTHMKTPLSPTVPLPDHMPFPFISSSRPFPVSPFHSLSTPSTPDIFRKGDKSNHINVPARTCRVGLLLLPSFLLPSPFQHLKPLAIFKPLSQMGG